ncbi:MAG: NAD(P)(+) transhydrogenase (Si-specific) [Planctomycetota bacterium]
MRQFDAVVIGTGPAGQRAAIQAAKLGKRVAAIEKERVVGGAAINTGTIPSKALREAVLHLTGASKRGLFGQTFGVQKKVTLSDLIGVSQQVMMHEREVARSHLLRNGVELIEGFARFDDSHQVTVENTEQTERIKADFFFIATGTKPAMPESVPFEANRVFTSDGLLHLDRLPKSMIVVGGGVIGTEYACMMATLGVKVTLVEGRRQVLGFVDEEITEAMQYHMRQNGITMRLGEKVKEISMIDPDKMKSDAAKKSAKVANEEFKAHANDIGQPVVPGDTNGDGIPDMPLVEAKLESGKKLRAQSLLYAIGRQGTVTAMNVKKAGLEASDRERLKVNEHFQTDVPHIYAMGDVIGFPALASTSMEQGRLAACHAFNVEAHSIPELFPFGIYAIPEISMVGKTEEQLTEAGIPYEAGIANYKEIARGQLLGDEQGMLKLLIHQDDRSILGVHAIGTGATELIHIGQTAMALGGKVDFFVNNVFNYPTLAETYKVAALNGMNKLRLI